ncbi:hypothetical protein JL722_8116 [Aureococcus anophagefferens]|nr:hypothetical protein JL722_8116 [Aureococcus anophagefferens]
MAALAKPAPAGAWPVAEAAGAAVADLPKLTAKYAEELSWKRHNKFACNFWLSSEARLVESAVIKTATTPCGRRSSRPSSTPGLGRRRRRGPARRLLPGAHGDLQPRRGPELMWSPPLVKTRRAEARFGAALAVMRRRMELARLVAYNKRATQKVGAKIAAFVGLVYEAGDDVDCAKMDGMALDDDVEDDAMICV